MEIHFWRPEVQDHRASVTDFWWGLSSWLADSHVLSVLTGASPVQKEKENSSFSYKATNTIDLGLYPYNLI